MLRIPSVGAVSRVCFLYKNNPISLINFPARNFSSRSLSSIWDSILNARHIRRHPASDRLKNAKRLANEKVHTKESSGKETSSDGGSNPQGDKDPRDFEELVAKLKKFFAIALFSYGILYMISPNKDGPPQFVPTTWSDFVNNILPTGQIHRIIVFPEREAAFVYTYAGSKNHKGEPLEPTYRLTIPSVDRFEMEIRAAEMAIGLPPEHWTPVEFRRMESVGQWLTLLFLGGLAIGGFMLYKRFKGSFNISNMMSSFTKARYTIIDPHTPEGKDKMKIKFKDVAGCHEAKQEVQEFVDYLKDPKKYNNLGARLPRGALLTGPPGCGKTLIAKALAAECVCTFISMNGSEFVEVIGGLGASRIRSLFADARTRKPCIIYIDEIDAVGRKRSEGKGGGMGGGSNEEEQTLNQLLVEMDGMDSGNGIIVIASTNRPDILDKALLRPGRFDRHITIDLPTVSERKEMFELYMKRIKLDHAANSVSHRLAQMTPGFSGADIGNVVNESAIRAAAIGKKTVSITDLHYALDRVLAGAEKRSRVLVEEEREIVAYHEAGHALVGWLLEHTDALLKVTIIPRTSAALGFAQYSPRDKKLYNKEELFDKMCMMLGGRCAENIKFGRITTGAEDDLKKVTRSAFAQVKVYGMSELIGPLSFPTGDDFQIKPYSKNLAGVLDQEASMLVGKAHRFTEDLIRNHTDKLEIIAQNLLKREVLSYDDVKQLIGPPTHGDKQVIDVVDGILPSENLNGNGNGSS